VHLDGAPVRSCSFPVSAAVGKKITTIEGLAASANSGKTLHKVQQAWIQHDVPQCGYCQSGMIMAVAALLKEKPQPTDADINAAITNICRCGTFQQVRAAIHAAAKA
jgi:isoquinoline 1-oxidoreductase alpha subunit